MGDAPPIGDEYLSNGNWKAPIHKKRNYKKVNKYKNTKLEKSPACLRNQLNYGWHASMNWCSLFGK